MTFEPLPASILFSDDLPMTMKDTPKLDDGAFDMDAEWECEHCKRKVRFGDTALSWCLNIICEDCLEKERDSENKAICESPENEPHL